MALKISRGISRLSSSSARTTAAALCILAIIGIALFAPRRNFIATGAKPHISQVRTESDKQMTSIKPVQADKVLTNVNESSVTKTARIVTCPRCRLNALPRVKEFVYEHAKSFEPSLKIDFILGEDPVLHLYENEKEVQKIDLESYNSEKIIQKLVQFGIRPSVETDVIRKALGRK